MKKQSYIFFILLLISIKAWCQQERIYQLPEPKRFISKVEIFAGPGLSFNRGNMFVENYRGEFANGNYVENRRLAKIGYSVGVGMYHRLNKRLDFNIRFQWDQKGSKAELNHPINPVNNDDREYRTSEYFYNYFTLPIVLKFYLDKKRKLALLSGGYISRIKSVEGKDSYFYPTSNIITRPSVSSKFVGRTLVGFDLDGGINSFSFIPGLQGFEEYDHGIVLGISYDLNINHLNTISFQLIDSYGLTNINKPNFTLIPSPVEKSHTVSLMVGYIYQRKAKN